MSSRPDAHDNVAMESFWATLQTELLDRREWNTRAELKTAIFNQRAVGLIEVFHNRKRRHSGLGFIFPAE